MKKKGIQIGLVTCALCTQLAGCSSSASTDSSSDTVLTNSEVDPLEEAQIVEVGDIKIPLPADWEEQPEEENIVYYGSNNEVSMLVSISISERTSYSTIPEDEREDAIERLTQKMKERDDERICTDVNIWEGSSTDPMVFEITYYADDYKPNPLAKHFKDFVINYGDYTYYIGFGGYEGSSSDFEIWDEIVQNISYAELADEASTTSETETTEESSPVVIAVEPDPDEETSKTEIIESNPTTTVDESSEEIESADWNPEYTLGSIYYSPGKFAFAILDFEREDVPKQTDYPYYDETYTLYYIYADFCNEVDDSDMIDFLDESVQIKQVLNTHHPDLPDIRDDRTIYNNNRQFYAEISGWETLMGVPETVGIYSVKGAIEVKVAFPSYNETVTYYLPQNYSYKSQD